MKKNYVFVRMNGAEKFFFEDGEENIVVVQAKTPEEAKEKLIASVSSEYEDEASQFEPEEVTELPKYFVVWEG